MIQNTRHDSTEKTQSAALLQFSRNATYDKYVSFLENFVSCISGFLSGINVEF